MHSFPLALNIGLSEPMVPRTQVEPVYTETHTPEFRYLGTEITDGKLVYDQESRCLDIDISDGKLVYDEESKCLGTEITDNLQNTTSNFST